MKAKKSLDCIRRLEQPIAFHCLRAFQLTVLVTLLICSQVARAQSPNTATMIVVVVDQAGAVVPDAKSRW